MPIKTLALYHKLPHQEVFEYMLASPHRQVIGAVLSFNVGPVT